MSEQPKLCAGQWLRRDGTITAISGGPRTYTDAIGLCFQNESWQSGAYRVFLDCSHPGDLIRPAVLGDVYTPVSASTATSGYVTKDSGQREEFPSGYQRDNRDGKGRFDLLPFEAIEELARLFERGAKKYGEANWRKGAPLSRYCDSMLRHAFQATAGREDEAHFISVAWNALCAYATRVMVRKGQLPAELDDLPKDAP